MSTQTPPSQHVVIVDGGGFSPPYDFALVSALCATNVNATLAMPTHTLRAWQDPDAIPMADSSAVQRTARKLATAAAYVARLAKIATSAALSRTDLVHVQWLPVPLLDRRFLQALRGRVPLVYTMHNTSNFHEPDHGLRNSGKRDAYKLFDRIIVHSEYSRQSALKSGVARADQLRVIPHGAFEYYRSLVTAPRAPDGPVQLLFAGSIKYYKGLDVLIEALPRLAAHTPAGSWQLTIAGHPGFPVDALRARVREYGVETSVGWSLRHQTERELANHLEACHAVVLPYREIDQSGVLLAAVGMHRTVVASSVGAFPEILRDGEHGLLVPHSDPKALAEALIRVVTDAQLRARGEAGMRELAETSLHWSTVAAQTAALYRELLQS